MLLSTRKRVFGVLLWAVSSFEALIACYALLNIPPDPKNAVLLGYSPYRLIMLGGTFLLALIFAFAAWQSSRARISSSRWFQLLRCQWTPYWLFYTVSLIIFGCLWFLLLPPPRLQGAFYERVQPIVALALAVAIQYMAVLMITAHTQAREAWQVLKQAVSRAQESQWIGWVCLGVSLAIGFITPYFTYHNLGDEGDTVTAGWLISSGQILYKDIFSHHFPFSYLWVALIAKIFGPSILALRLSVVVLRTVLFGVTMRFSRYWVPIGLAALLWSVIGPLFLANMLLYDTFEALFIVSAFLVTFAMIQGKVSPTPAQLVFVGGLSSLAFLSNPVLILSGACLIGFLFLSGLFSDGSWSQRIRQGVYRGGIALAAAAGCVLIYLLSLIVTGSLMDFVEYGIRFNTLVYNRYTNWQPELMHLINPIFKGLGFYGLPGERQHRLTISGSSLATWISGYSPGSLPGRL